MELNLKLKQIKLAGFKSFVDPTVLDLRSNLVCIVGPNGCGKSNVIDAVRCVMGESSAKTLRGDSLIDMIFNGSSTRKPIGQASVELIFDNSEGRIGGEYAAYAEISVRREFNRDNVSNYYLNGTRCRRSDIFDVFQGTGLGPKSYSIIQQGMVSKIIESKPEELRGFFETASGVDGYKRSRHETGLRMKHTTENLARLEDLREEQTKLLERLKRQSESAQKFRVYNTEKELLESQLLILRWQEYDQKIASYSQEVLSLSVNLEEKLAARTNLGASLEKVRLEHEEKSAIFNDVQSRYYELGSQVARHEQSLQHSKERKLQLETDILLLVKAIDEINMQKTADTSTLFACEQKLAEITPEYEQACAAAEQADELYQEARLDLDNWNAEWNDFQQQSQAPQQQAEVQKIRIEQIDKQTRDLQARVDRLQQESASLDIPGLQIIVEDLTVQLLSLEEKTNNLKQEITAIQQAIGTQRNELQQQQDQLNTVRNLVQQSKGREASLLALQQAALGKDDRALQDWLQQNNLQDTPRLAESLQVDAGWETAVETVLDSYLEAVCVTDNWGSVAAAVADLTDGNLTILGSNKNLNSNIAPTADLLASKVKTSLAIDELLAGVYVADNLSAALAMRGKLTNNQSIVTKDGIWLSNCWLRVARARDTRSGVLQREQEIHDLKACLEQQTDLAASLETAIQQSSDNLHTLETELAEKQKVLNQDAVLLRDLTSKYSGAQQKLENMQSRKQRISIEIEDHQQQLNANSTESSAARTELEIAIESMAGLSIRKQELLDSKEGLQERERLTKQIAKEQQVNMHDLEITKQNLATQYSGLQHTISRVDQQLSGSIERRQQLQQAILDEAAPTVLLQEQLDQLLEDRAAVDTELQEARRELEVFEEQMKLQEKQRQELEDAAQKIKDVLDKCRLDRQSLEVRKETINEQLAASNLDPQVILQALPPEAEESAWAERIESLNKKITNLGAINMAAIEEFDAETQRNQYLEAQYVDLKEALETLENAIKKIDRETKTKFKEAFDQINANFSTLFPKLFGGGKAYLELVGDDLLEAGISVMAMPPGKKNATIHLLSGGEKALTAVSLVFAIFQLNPSPFCILDEVDAPLDESNVVRFSNLIKEMSSAVQFIFITHNKTTMEIANQLIGVTMKEPGVSRLVSVDINEAVEMAIA